MEIINSNENKTYKYIRSLGAKKGRDENAAFIIEGWRVTQEALQYADVELIAVSAAFAEKRVSEMNLLPPDRVIVLANHLTDKLSQTETTQGILAVCRKTKYKLEDLLNNGKTSKLFLLAEEINDPGNLGSIIRSADAAGADGVVLSHGCAELFNPKVLRGSAGSVFHLPIVCGAELPGVIGFLQRNGVGVYAAHLAGAVYPYGMDLTGDCAFLIGNEARGISRETASLAVAYVKLPMPGRAESLNAAGAAGILLYEAVRQRAGMGGK